MQLKLVSSSIQYALFSLKDIALLMKYDHLINQHRLAFILAYFILQCLIFHVIANWRLDIFSCIPLNRCLCSVEACLTSFVYEEL